MGPHDLLCKWCSTFVGKGKKFCSIFCESRYTRSKRRKLAFRRPAYSGGNHHDKDYESPRSSKTAPERKETFLEDVITAIENDKPSPERDKRPDGSTTERSSDKPSPASTDRLNTSGYSQQKESASTVVPKLDLNSPKAVTNTEKKKVSGRQLRESKLLKDKDMNNDKDKKVTSHAGKEPENKVVKDKDETKEKEENPKDSRINSSQMTKQTDITIKKDVRSKTQTLLVHKSESKIPIRNRTIGSGREDLNKTVPLTGNSSELDDTVKELKTKRLSSLNDRKKLENENDSTDSDILNRAAQRQKSKTALELEKKIRSSGYGNPVNPRLRPMALKPRSATVSGSGSKYSRDSSARSSKSSHKDVSGDTRPVNSGRNRGNWELIPTTIKEEESKNGKYNGNTSLENEDPTPRTSQRTVTKTDSGRELGKISEILREESTHSDLLSQTELQIRLSSIKRKVEVRKRGRDSRSSHGSDLDTSFQDSTTDLTTDRDLLNTSVGTTKTDKTSRSSARSNITRISKQFQALKVE